MAFRDFREETKDSWGTEKDGPLLLSQIEAGCLLRIADAQEKMVQPFVSLLAEVERLSRSNEEKDYAIGRMTRSNAALRGVITKLKKAR